MGGGDVEEDDLVRPLAVVFLGALHRVADLFDADKVDTLDDLPVPDVETGDDPFIQHPLTPYLIMAAFSPSQSGLHAVPGRNWSRRTGPGR